MKHCFPVFFCTETSWSLRGEVRWLSNPWRLSIARHHFRDSAETAHTMSSLRRGAWGLAMFLLKGKKRRQMQTVTTKALLVLQKHSLSPWSFWLLWQTFSPQSTSGYCLAYCTSPVKLLWQLWPVFPGKTQVSATAKTEIWVWEPTLSTLSDKQRDIYTQKRQPLFLGK